MRLLPTAVAAFRCLVSLAAGLAAGLASNPAAAEPATLADLQGLTLAANWIEDQTFRTESNQKPRTSRSPRQITLSFGPGDAIGHTIVRNAGGKTSTENRQMQIGKTQMTGFGFVGWSFEDGKLVYVETLFSGARRLTISIDKAGGKLGCTIAAGVAREGNNPVLAPSIVRKGEKVELIEVKSTGGDCTIGKG